MIHTSPRPQVRLASTSLTADMKVSSIILFHIALARAHPHHIPSTSTPYPPPLPLPLQTLWTENVARFFHIVLVRARPNPQAMTPGNTTPSP